MPDLRRAGRTLYRRRQAAGRQDQGLFLCLRRLVRVGRHRADHQRGIHPQPLSGMGFLGTDRRPADREYRRHPRLAETGHPHRVLHQDRSGHHGFLRPVQQHRQVRPLRPRHRLDRDPDRHPLHVVVRHQGAENRQQAAGHYHRLRDLRLRYVCRHRDRCRLRCQEG